MDASGVGPAVVVRRLGAGDESVLALLARDDADFDLDGGAGRRRPLRTRPLGPYLADPHVLHWTAWAGEEVVGSLVCHVLPMRKQPARELVLYEIGVRSGWRRRGVGRQLISRS